MQPGELSKRLWDRHDIVRTKWLTDRMEVLAAVTELFGSEVSNRCSILSSTTFGRFACVRIGAIAWLEAERAGVTKSVVRAD